MGNRLTREQIAALLDTPELVTDATVILTEEDRAEFEQMRRTRMALSALDDLEPPAGQWDRIASRLPASGGRRSIPWPLQAAAVFALFAAGLIVGQSIRVDEGTLETGPVALEATSTPGLPQPTQMDGPAADYVANVAELVELRDAGWAERDPVWQRDPAAVAERIVHLDELLDASREALVRVPADPVLNNFLFDVADERATLATQLDESLRMATLEY